MLWITEMNKIVGKLKTLIEDIHHHIIYSSFALTFLPFPKGRTSSIVHAEPGHVWGGHYSSSVLSLAPDPVSCMIPALPCPGAVTPVTRGWIARRYSMFWRLLWSPALWPSSFIRPPFDWNGVHCPAPFPRSSPLPLCVPLC